MSRTSAELSSRQSRMVIAAIMLGLLLGGMEATVVATALPTIVGKLSGLNLYAWPMAVYILASAASGPLFGKLSDLYGRKKWYIASLALFLAGSALCGFSRNMPQLIAFRSLQGLGAGGVLPLGITIAGDMFPFEKRAKVQPLFTMVWGLASLIGPPLGSWLALRDWRLIFFVNVPFGILSGILLSAFFHEAPRAEAARKIDYLGAFLLVLGILGLELALPGESAAAVAAWRYGAGAAALLSLFLFVQMEKTAREPLLPLSLLKYRMFSSASACQFFTGMALFGSISFIPLYVQAVMGLGVQQVGRIIMWFLIVWVVFSTLSSRMMIRMGYRILVFTGTVLVLAGFAVLSRMTQNSPAGTLLWATALLGAGMGWIMAPLIVAVQSSIPKDQLGIATSSQVLFRTVGASIGVSIMGSVMAGRMQKAIPAVLPTASNPFLRAALQKIFKSPNLILDPVHHAQLQAGVLASMKSVMSFSLHGVFTVALAAAVLAAAAGFAVPGGKAEKHFYQEG